MNNYPVLQRIRFRLIDTLEGRNRFTLVLIKGRINNVAILENNIRTARIGLERKRMLHPFLIIALARHQHTKN